MQNNTDLQPQALIGPARVLMPVDFSPPAVGAARNPLGAMTESMATRLAWLPFLVGMSRAHLELLAECAIAVEFKKGEMLFREGEVADGIYLIEGGKISRESSTGENETTVCDGWMFPPHLRTCSVRALEPTTAIFLSAPLLREYCEKDTSLGYDFLKRLCLLTYQHVLGVRRKMANIYIDPANRPNTLPPF